MNHLFKPIPITVFLFLIGMLAFNLWVGTVVPDPVALKIIRVAGILMTIGFLSYVYILNQQCDARAVDKRYQCLHKKGHSGPHCCRRIVVEVHEWQE